MELYWCTWQDGLPLAVQFALKGHTVIGADVNEETVTLVNAGDCAPFR